MDQLASGVSRLGISNQSGAQTPFNPQEIATLLSDYYQLMSRMRYFSPDCIKYPPHDPPVDISRAKSLGLEPQAIELLQVLPYVEGLNNEDEFILGGSFADFRQPRILEQSRDPDYASPQGDYEEENGKYVMPWVLVLNECGNHGSIMHLDTRNSHITMLWQGGAGGGNADPYFHGKFDRGASQKHEHPVNKNRIEHFPSRPAKELFADFTNCLMTLEWIPFNTYGPRVFTSDGKSQEYKDIKMVFETYGWPGNLDSEGFDAASRRWKEFDRVRRHSNEMLTKVKELEKEIDHMNKNEKKIMGRSQFKDHVSWLETQKAEAIEDAAGVTDEDSAFEKAWEKHIRSGIERKKQDLNYYRDDGKKYATEEKIRDLEIGIAALEKRIKEVRMLPKTASDAIKHQQDEGKWICCR